jgi:hypothetical protein
VNQNRVTWDITTRGDAAEKDAQMTLLYPNPTTQYTENASMHVQIILNLKQIEKPVLTLQFQALSIDVSDYNITPSFISNVKVLPSDAIRLSVLQNLTSWPLIQNQIINPAYIHVKSLIENSSFNQTIYSRFNWVNETIYDLKEPYNTSQMDMIPPISANFTDNSFHISICNISARAFFGLINAGALTNISNQDITIGDNLDSLHYPYNGTFLFPSFILLNNENKFQWNTNNPIQGTFSSSNTPQSKKNDIKSEFEIDVKNTDLNLLSFFTGKTELSMGLYLKETQNRYTTQLPESFTLPKNIKIPLLPSDAFRVCVEEKVFTEKQINEFLNLNKELFHNQLNTIFPLIKGESHLDKTIFEESLIWDKNISLMDNNTPITISSSIHTSFPLLFDFSIFPPAVSIQTLNLSFHGIPDQDVNYSMIFPKGISIKVEDELDRVLIQEQDDGKIRFTLSFNASEQEKINRVLCTIQPSALYILGMFMPCIMSIIITIVLFLIVFFIRNRRKTIPPSHPETPPQDDNEEYYIPPPPSNRK